MKLSINVNKQYFNQLSEKQYKFCGLIMQRRAMPIFESI